MNIENLKQNNITKTKPNTCCCQGLGQTYENLSQIENPKTNKTQTNPETLKKIENYAKTLNISNISYANNINQYYLKNTNTEYTNAIILTIEMDQKILEAGAGNTAQEYNDQLYYKFGNITYQISDYIRNLGYQTLVAHPKEDLIDFSKIGEKAGLGAIGKSGLLISPEHGPKQKISAILVKIENLPIKANHYTWIKEYCTYCRRCVKFCPQNAIKDSKTNTNEKLDSNKCIGCTQGCTECIKTCPFYNKGYNETKEKYEKIKSRKNINKND